MGSVKGPISMECAAGGSCSLKLSGLPIESIDAQCDVGECLVPTDQELGNTTGGCLGGLGRCDWILPESLAPYGGSFRVGVLQYLACVEVTQLGLLVSAPAVRARCGVTIKQWNNVLHASWQERSHWLPAREGCFFCNPVKVSDSSMMHRVCVQ